MITDLFYSKARPSLFYLIFALLSCSSALGQNCIWSRSASVSGWSVATDVKGNAYVCGTFTGKSVSLGGISLKNNDTSGKITDAFIAKYDSSGKIIWARGIGAHTIGYGLWMRGIATDNTGNVYITGAYSVGAFFGNDTLYSGSSLREIYLARYDTSGKLIWAKSFGDGGYWANHGEDVPMGVRCTKSGNILMTGYFNSDSLVLGSYPLPNAGGHHGGSDLFVAKLSSAGKIIWAKGFGGMSVDYANSLAIDSKENIYVTGSFGSPAYGISGGSPITFGSTTLSAAGSSYDDMFLTKLDSSGKVIWARRAGNTHIERGISVATDRYKGVYVGGYFSSASVTFGNTTLNNNNSVAPILADIFLAKYDSAGNVIWAKSMGSSGYDEETSVATDSSGNPYISYNASYKSTLMRYDSGGTAIWLINPAVSASAYVATDHFGNLYGAGAILAKFSQCTLPSKPGAISGSSTLCSNSKNITYSIASVTGAYSYTWTLPKDFSGTSTTNSITVNPGSASGYISVTADNYCGSSEAQKLYIKVNPSYHIEDTVTICWRDSFTVNKHSYKFAGTYYDTMQTANSCDSIRVTTIKVNPSYTDYYYPVICQGDYYTVNSHKYTTTNTYYDTFQTIKGCDSVIITALKVNPSYKIENPQTICDGDSYTPKERTYRIAGTYYDTFYTNKGCDSIIVTKLKLWPRYVINNPQPVCRGDYYSINGHKYYWGTNYDTFYTVHGCDSIIETVITVNQTYAMYNPQYICKGSSYSIHSHTYKLENTYYDTFHTVTGCDSVIATALFYYPWYEIDNRQNICQGSSYTFNSHTYTKTGTYYDSFLTSKGCDSVIITRLKVNPVYVINNPQTICQGSYYFDGSHVYTKAGTYKDTFRTSTFCDSIIVTTLIVSPPFTSTNPQTICNGGTYWIGSHGYKSSGTYYDTLHSVKGCDSIVTTVITQTTVDTSVTISGNVLTANANNASYQWRDCEASQIITGETSKTFKPKKKGVFAVVVTQNNCTASSACRQFTPLGIEENDLKEFIRIYPNPSEGKFTIEAANAKGEIFIYNLLGENIWSGKLLPSRTEIDLSIQAKGIYFVKFDLNGRFYWRKIVLE